MGTTLASATPVLRRGAIATLLAAALSLCATPAADPAGPASGPASGPTTGLTTGPTTGSTAPPPPTMTATFGQASYVPGEVAQLAITANASQLTAQPIAAFSSSQNPYAPIADDPTVGAALTVPWHPGAGLLDVRLPRLPSGVYFMRVTTTTGQAVAPFVVRPAHLGTAPVAVIIPTYTWQAYNRWGGGTWYACGCVHTVDLTRPYLSGGVPYNFGQYDRDFLRWLAQAKARVDFLTDQDLEAITSGAQLRHSYRMVVFESHSEYVTSHIYDITQQYRDLGGHLAFLSANDFFRKVVVAGTSMTLIGRWRDLSRPEAALLGAQYLGWYENLYPNQPYMVVGAHRVPWLFAGTGLTNGDLITGFFGIEIDGVTRASPPGTIVVADIQDIFPRQTADMTYYTTSAGAEVFDAGTIDFGGAANNPYVADMLANLWKHMAAVTLRPKISATSLPGRAAGAG